MSEFNALLKKALQVEREHQKLTSLSGQKLTAKAYLAEALKNARCTEKDLLRLRKEFEDPDGPGLEAAQFALKKMITAIKSPNWPWPPAQPAKLRYLGVSEAVLAELAPLRTGPMQLFALAVQRATELHPEVFGEIESSEAWKRRVEQLKRERIDLYARIATAYSQDDILVDDLDATGRARVAFRLSGGAVPIYPKENAGERLTAWLLANETAIA